MAYSEVPDATAPLILIGTLCFCQQLSAARSYAKTFEIEFSHCLFCQNTSESYDTLSS